MTFPPNHDDETLHAGVDLPTESLTAGGSEAHQKRDGGAPEQQTYQAPPQRNFSVNAATSSSRHLFLYFD